MRHTKKDNLVSFIVGLVIAIPLSFIANRETTYEEPTEVVAEETDTDESVGATSGVSTTLKDNIDISKIPEKKPIASEETPVDDVSWEDIEMLAHLLHGEAGADWCSDEMVYYVGSVVLNRMNSEYFPDTLEEVIFQDGQYACTWDGNYYKEPTERYYEIAEALLRNGSVLPEDVVYQAEFIQGSGVYKKVQNMYFCYQ